MAPELTDDAILDRLRTAEHVQSPNPRVVRVDREAFLDGTEDDDERAVLDEATRALLEKLGGRVGRVQMRQPARRAGHEVAAPPTTVWFYELPAAALARKKS